VNPGEFVVGAAPGSIRSLDPDDDGAFIGTAYLPRAAEYTIKTRNVFGTTHSTDHTALNTAHSGVWDVTAQSLLLQEMMDRFSRGAYGIKIRVGLDRLAIQQADLVTVNVPAARFTAFGQQGLDNTVKFEVTGRRVEMFGPNPGIILTLVYATKTGATNPTRVWNIAHGNRIAPFGRVNEAIDLDIGENHIADGLGVSAGAGLTIDIAAGVGSNMATRASFPGDTGITLSALRDTYIAYDTNEGVAVPKETTIGGAQPALDTSEVWIAKVVTGAGSVSSVTDLRTTTAMDGNKLVGGSVDAAQKITPETVTYVEVADGTLGPININQQYSRANLLTNPTLGAFTRG
jgi:hypothetical protein